MESVILATALWIAKSDLLLWLLLKIILTRFCASLTGKKRSIVARVSSPTLQWIFQETNFLHSYSTSPTPVHQHMGTEAHSLEPLARLSLALNIRENPRWGTCALRITAETGHWVQSCTQNPSFFLTSGGIAISKINASEERSYAGLDCHYWCYLWIVDFENCYLRPRYAYTSEASSWSFWYKCRCFSRCQRREKSASGHFWRMILCV